MLSWGKMVSNDSFTHPGVVVYRKTGEMWMTGNILWQRKKETCSVFTKQQVHASCIGPACHCGYFDKVGREAIGVIFDEYWKQ